MNFALFVCYTWSNNHHHTKQHFTLYFQINWGSSGQAHTYLKALRFARRLDDVEDHVKNFRIQCLCLTGQPSLRPNLVHFASHLTKHFGLLLCGEVVETSSLSQQITQTESKWLKKHKIKAFHQIVQG